VAFHSQTTFICNGCKCTGLVSCCGILEPNESRIFPNAEVHILQKGKKKANKTVWYQVCYVIKETLFKELPDATLQRYKIAYACIMPLQDAALCSFGEDKYVHTNGSLK